MISEEKGGAMPRGLFDIHSTVFEGDGVNVLGVSGQRGWGVGWGGGGLCVVMYRRRDPCGHSVSSGAMDHTQLHGQNTDRKGSIQGPIHTI